MLAISGVDRTSRDGIEGVDGRPYPGDDAVVASYMTFVRHGLMKKETP